MLFFLVPDFSPSDYAYMWENVNIARGALFFLMFLTLQQKNQLSFDTIFYPVFLLL